MKENDWGKKTKQHNKSDRELREGCSSCRRLSGISVLPEQETDIPKDSKIRFRNKSTERSRMRKSTSKTDIFVMLSPRLGSSVILRNENIS